MATVDPPVRLATDADLKVQVRATTDYDALVLADGDLDEVVATAKAEVMGEAGTGSITFYGDLNAERALFWTTCLFCKIRAGEIEGVPMSLGDIDIESLTAGGEYGSGPVLWLQNARNYSRRITDGGARYGIRSLTRGGTRNYGDERDGTGSL